MTGSVADPPESGPAEPSPADPSPADPLASDPSAVDPSAVDPSAADPLASDGSPVADDGYAGPAEVISGDRTVAVSVTLSGHFDPVSGKYSWYGRVAAGPEVTALLAEGVRAVRLRTPHTEVETALSDIDPWGRPRVEGFGPAPFPVPTAAPSD